MACVGEYGCKGVIARYNLPLAVYGRVLGSVLLMELACRLLGGEGGDVEGAFSARGKELAAHLVGYDTHVEA